MTFAHLAGVLAEVSVLGQAFSAAGHRLFLVGGIVRDQLLDHPLDASSDIDLTTDAHPVEIKRIVAPLADDLWTQGERFGTIGMRTGGRDFEITTHRAESYAGESRKPEVSFGNDIEVDLSRRDFTVNAMAIEVPDGDLVDPYGGADDLAAGRLRTPLDADVSFSDDPLRMLRAARFAAKYDLEPDDRLVASAISLHDRMQIVAIERIGVEVRRLLGIDEVGPGLRFLADTGVLAEVLGHGDAAIRAAVGDRIDAAVEVAVPLPADWHLRLAAMGLTAFDDADGVRSMCNRLRLSGDDRSAVVALATAALGVVEATDLDAETLRRWRWTCDDPDPAIELAAAIGDAHRAAAFRTALEDLAESETLDASAFIDGATIMAVLDASPGPIIGRAQVYLRDVYFAHGPLTESEQVELLRNWTPAD